MICISISKVELGLGIGLTYKLRSLGFTQFEGYIKVEKNLLRESITALCHPTEKDLITMNFDRIKEELKR